MPELSSTARCCITAGSDMENGRARSLTEAGLRASRSTIARRVGSASAWKARSRGDGWLSMCLSNTARIVKQWL